MGDRANFGVRQGNDIVFLYGHTAGHNMLATLAGALEMVKSHGRLSDESYATRILFSQIVGLDWDHGLGWGMTINRIDDNQHKVPVVDFRKSEVSLYNEDDLDNPIVTFGIEGFINRYAKPLASL